MPERTQERILPNAWNISIIWLHQKPSQNEVCKNKIIYSTHEMSLHLGQSSAERLISAPHPVNWGGSAGAGGPTSRKAHSHGGPVGVACPLGLSQGSEPQPCSFPHGLCLKASPQVAQASLCNGGWVPKVAHLLSSDSKGGYIYPLLNRNKIKIFGDDAFKLPQSIFSSLRDRKSRYLEHRARGGIVALTFTLLSRILQQRVLMHLIHLSRRNSAWCLWAGFFHSWESSGAPCAPGLLQEARARGFQPSLSGLFSSETDIRGGLWVMQLKKYNDIKVFGLFIRAKCLASHLPTAIYLRISPDC